MVVLFSEHVQKYFVRYRTEFIVKTSAHILTEDKHFETSFETS